MHRDLLGVFSPVGSPCGGSAKRHDSQVLTFPARISPPLWVRFGL